ERIRRLPSRATFALSLLIDDMLQETFNPDENLKLTSPDCPVSRDVVPARALFGHGHAPDRCAALKELGVKRSSPLIPKGPDRPAGYVSRDLVFPMLLEPLKVPSRWATVEAPRVLARVEAS